MAPASGCPNLRAVPAHSNRQADAAVLPGGAKLIGRHGHGAEARGRFRMDPAEARLLLGDRVRAQARVVREHHELHVLERVGGRRAHRHAIDDDGDLGFEVDAVRLRRQRHVLLGPEEVVRAALVHQRLRARLVDDGLPEGALHELAVARECRAVEPLPCARQRRGELGLVERESRRGRRRASSVDGERARARARCAPTTRAPPAGSERYAPR